MKRFAISLIFCFAVMACEKEKPVVDPVVVTPVDPKPVDPTPSPQNAEAAELDKVQKACFNYFWYGHLDSGMSFERSSNSNLVTTGGTGFGIMGMAAAVERKYITRDEAIQKMQKILSFLERAEKAHGVFAHWYNPNSALIQKFSEQDDGGDLVETSFLMAGLLTARAYFDKEVTAETEIRNRITKLWEAVEWNWHVYQGNLMWHWSPKFLFQRNNPIKGYHEALVTYILALSSPKYAIDASVYNNCWKNASNFINGREYHGYKLPIGPDYGGPLFFTHYSFLGLDPRLMQDDLTNYWHQNVSHTLINRAYCLESAPKANLYENGYWGLTASDNQKGYDAHSPTKDLGTLTPTAAMSSMPYTPFYSLQAMKKMLSNDKIFNPTYGFVDAFTPKENWYSEQFLAIDQNPIPVMIENYRTGLIWKLFMSIPEVKSGLAKAGINRPAYKTGFNLVVIDKNAKPFDMIKHVDTQLYTIDYYLEGNENMNLTLFDKDGKEVKKIIDNKQGAMGQNKAEFTAEKGEFTLNLTVGMTMKEMKVRLN